MFYEIPGTSKLPTLVFDDHGLSVDSLTEKGFYEYPKIVGPRITNSSPFATYSILQFSYRGKQVFVPFAHRYERKLRSALEELKHLPTSQATASASAAPPTPAQPASTIPVEDLERLKRLLDEDIITQEEFDAKKKQLLGLDA